MNIGNKLTKNFYGDLLTFFASVIMVQFSLLAIADDYRLNPKALHGGFEEYAKPTDPEVCSIYLKNLRYFARRNTPMSCDRPIAQQLKDKIHKVEWEDLDPAQYPEIFRLAAAELPSIKATTEKELIWIEEAIKRRDFVFRRAKLDLSGDPAQYYLNSKVRVFPGKFYIVQYGDDVTETFHRTEILRCKPIRGNTPGNIPSSHIRLYMVTPDMKELINPLGSLGFGWYGENIRIINNMPYVEGLRSDASIDLFQINPQKPVSLEPVCNFIFKKSLERK